MVNSRNWSGKLVLEVTDRWAFQLQHSILLLLSVICFEQLTIDKVAFHQSSASIEELSFTVLFIQLPKTSIKAAVLAVHLAISASHVILIVSFVNVAARPCVYSISLFFIIFELPLVFVTYTTATLPQSVTISQTFAEVSFIILPIIPKELSKAIEFTLAVVTFVKVSVFEVLHAFTVLDKIDEITFISITLRVSKHSKAIGLPLSPFANICISFIVLPHAAAMLQVVPPFSFVGLAIWPFVLSLAVDLPTLILPLICAAVTKLLEPLSMPEVVFPASLIDLSAIVYHDADAFPLVFTIISVVYGLFVFFEPEMW